MAKKRHSKKDRRTNTIKPSLWQRIGYVPTKPSVREMQRKFYEERMNLPEGEGTGRSSGSNKRLRKLLGHY